MPQHHILVATDRAIPLALMVNELITNAANSRLRRRIGLQNPGWFGADVDTIRVSVRDEGIGLPPTFDLAETKGLGMRLVRAFLQQLAATVAINSQSRHRICGISSPRTQAVTIMRRRYQLDAGLRGVEHSLAYRKFA